MIDDEYIDEDCCDVCGEFVDDCICDEEDEQDEKDEEDCDAR